MRKSFYLFLQFEYKEKQTRELTKKKGDQKSEKKMWNSKGYKSDVFAIIRNRKSILGGRGKGGTLAKKKY